MKELIQRWPRVAAIVLGCVLVLGPVVGLEILLRAKAWLTTPPEEAPLESNFFDLVEPEPILGFVPRASTAFDETLTRGGMGVYRVRYEIDEYHRRVTPVEHPENRLCVALFFGCSFTFGTGVNGDDTLPAQFGRTLDCFVPVNCGFGGYGPQSFWVQARNPYLLGSLPHMRGVAIYTFIDDHVNRLAGAPGVVMTWGARLPRLTEKNGQITQLGLFIDDLSATDWMLQRVRTLHLFRFIAARMSMPEPDIGTRARQLDFVAHVLIDAARNLRERMAELQVCVVAFPGATLGSGLFDRLAGEPILCLDYSELPELAGHSERELHIGDGGPGYPGHPSPLLYQLVAERLTRDIAEKAVVCCRD